MSDFEKDQITEKTKPKKQRKTPKKQEELPTTTKKSKIVRSPSPESNPYSDDDKEEDNASQNDVTQSNPSARKPTVKPHIEDLYPPNNSTTSSSSSSFPHEHTDCCFHSTVNRYQPESQPALPTYF